MRDKSHERFECHQPPSTLSSDGMDAWYHKQKQREQELRERRREAEQMLRGYRGGRESFGYSETRSKAENDGYSHSTRGGTPRGMTGMTTPRDGAAVIMATPMSAISQLSEALDDPHSFKHAQVNLAFDLEKERQARSGPEQEERYAEDEKKLEDQQDAQLRTREEDVEVTIWRNFVSSTPGAKFQPEAGRYHLYVADIRMHYLCVIGAYKLTHTLAFSLSRVINTAT
jgi:hypothetical protein